MIDQPNNSNELNGLKSGSELINNASGGSVAQRLQNGFAAEDGIRYPALKLQSISSNCRISEVDCEPSHDKRK